MFVLPSERKKIFWKKSEKGDSTFLPRLLLIHYQDFSYNHAISKFHLFRRKNKQSDLIIYEAIYGTSPATLDVLYGHEAQRYPESKFLQEHF